MVLRCLFETILFAKAEKCEFHAPTVSFLGFIVQQGQLSPDLVKVQALAEWITPTTQRKAAFSRLKVPFIAAQGYQPPIFDYQEKEVVVPSVRANLRRCRTIW